ncbi:hypothetical protein [Loktanella atrilutea]|uniref:hypothetical protein n=1 Tax=Loktanella atrilutea TaxID=366533 RepID=UPI001C4A446A|nr:hypothetical protein [Loktanella atrilutea]
MANEPAFNMRIAGNVTYLRCHVLQLAVVPADLDKCEQVPWGVATWVMKAASGAGGPLLRQNRHKITLREIDFQPIAEGRNDAVPGAHEALPGVDRINAQKQARDRLDRDLPAVIHQLPGQKRTVRQAVLIGVVVDKIP